MIKEWATVVSWQNGVALVHCDVKASCSSCASRAGCGGRVLNKLGPQTSHTLSVPCEQPLSAGQKVELGIAESSLLGSAVLVYMAPLVGLFVMASIFQVLFANDFASLCGAIFGRRWRVSGRSRSFAWLSLPAVVAAGYYQRRFTARFSPHRDAFLPTGSVISLALIFIYNSRKNSSFTPVMLAVRAFPGFVDVV